MRTFPVIFVTIIAISFCFHEYKLKAEALHTAIDQQTVRRKTKTGLVAIDETKAGQGYILFTPLSSSGIVYLIDKKGKVVHIWDLPYPPGLYGYLLPNGNLFYNGKVEDETWDLWPGWKGFKGGLMLELDWEGNTVWEYSDPYQHHDARRTSSGGVMYLAIEKVPEEVAGQVQGGVEGTDINGMWADAVIEVDADGNRLWEWHAYEHLDYETDVIQPNCSREEWTHADAVVPLENDQVLVSFRNISVLGIIDKNTNKFVWKLGDNTLAQQHDPSLLDNGNVLVFDNGAYRKRVSHSYSRVIEINPGTNKIIWSYQDSPSWNFFSANVSGAQRLPNGNTLITEGLFGRIFEVTPERDIVWEYVNPYFFGKEGLEDNIIFKALHYSSEEISLPVNKR